MNLHDLSMYNINMSYWSYIEFPDLWAHWVSFYYVHKYVMMILHNFQILVLRIFCVI